MANKLRSLIIILITLSFMSFEFSNGENVVCDNKLEFVSSKNESFTFKVSTQDNYKASLFIFEEGGYVLVETLSGTNTQEIIFNNIQTSKVYKLITKYSTESPLCAVRQLTGLTL